MNKNVVLTGFMGVGKTVIARRVARIMGRRLIDTDELIEKKTGMSIPNIFEKHSQEYFRNIESLVVREISRKSNLVIATGGGVVLRKQNIENLRQNGIIINLTADFEKIYNNLIKSNNRPLIKEKTKLEIKQIFEERKEFYKDCDFIMDLTDMSPWYSAKEISRLYKRLYY